MKKADKKAMKKFRSGQNEALLGGAIIGATPALTTRVIKDDKRRRLTIKGTKGTKLGFALGVGLLGKSVHTKSKALGQHSKSKNKPVASAVSSSIGTYLESIVGVAAGGIAGGAALKKLSKIGKVLSLIHI